MEASLAGADSGRHTLLRQQLPLALQGGRPIDPAVAAIPTERPVRRDDPVAGDDQRDRVATKGATSPWALTAIVSGPFGPVRVAMLTSTIDRS